MPQPLSWRGNKKNMGQLYFDEESIMKFQNPYLNFEQTHGRAQGQA